MADAFTKAVQSRPLLAYIRKAMKTRVGAMANIIMANREIKGLSELIGAKPPTVDLDPHIIQQMMQSLQSLSVKNNKSPLPAVPASVQGATQSATAAATQSATAAAAQAPLPATQAAQATQGASQIRPAANVPVPSSVSPSALQPINNPTLQQRQQYADNYNRMVKMDNQQNFQRAHNKLWYQYGHMPVVQDHLAKARAYFEKKAAQKAAPPQFYTPRNNSQNVTNAGVPQGFHSPMNGTPNNRFRFYNPPAGQNGHIEELEGGKYHIGFYNPPPNQPGHISNLAPGYHPGFINPPSGPGHIPGLAPGSHLGFYNPPSGPGHVDKLPVGLHRGFVDPTTGILHPGIDNPADGAPGHIKGLPVGHIPNLRRLQQQIFATSPNANFRPNAVSQKLRITMPNSVPLPTFGPTHNKIVPTTGTLPFFNRKQNQKASIIPFHGGNPAHMKPGERYWIHNPPENANGHIKGLAPGHHPVFYNPPEKSPGHVQGFAHGYHKGFIDKNGKHHEGIYNPVNGGIPNIGHGHITNANKIEKARKHNLQQAEERAAKARKKAEENAEKAEHAAKARKEAADKKRHNNELEKLAEALGEQQRERRQRPKSGATTRSKNPFPAKLKRTS